MNFNNTMYSTCLLVCLCVFVCPLDKYLAKEMFNFCLQFLPDAFLIAL